MVQVTATSSDVAVFTGGRLQFEVAADTVGGLYRELEARFPGLGEFARRRMSISIDGEIHAQAFAEPLSPDSEVFLIPKIGGG